jgi:hypothetical protein
MKLPTPPGPLVFKSYFLIVQCLDLWLKSSCTRREATDLSSLISMALLSRPLSRARFESSTEG